MIAIVVFHVLMILLSLGIVSRIVPVNLVGDMLGYLHSTIGITAPPLEKARTYALVWIGTTVIIVDGCISLLLLIASMTKSA